MPRKVGRPSTKPTPPALQRVYHVMESYGVDNVNKLIKVLKERESSAIRDRLTFDRHLALWIGEGRGLGVPIDWLIQVSQMTKARIEWLKTGQGEVYEDDPTVSTFGPGADVCLAYWKRHAPQDRSLWSRLGCLLPKYREYLSYQCNLLERERSEGEDQQMNTSQRLGCRVIHTALLFHENGDVEEE